MRSHSWWVVEPGYLLNSRAELGGFFLILCPQFKAVIFFFSISKGKLENELSSLLPLSPSSPPHLPPTPHQSIHFQEKAFGKQIWKAWALLDMHLAAIFIAKVLPNV